MKDLKLWYLKNAIKLCNYALKLSGSEEDQNEINSVVEIKNYFIREYERIKIK